MFSFHFTFPCKLFTFNTVFRFGVQIKSKIKHCKFELGTALRSIPNSCRGDRCLVGSAARCLWVAYESLALCCEGSIWGFPPSSAGADTHLSLSCVPLDLQHSAAYSLGLLGVSLCASGSWRVLLWLLTIIIK